MAHRQRQQLVRAAAGVPWTGSGPIFTTGKGTAITARNLTRDFKKVLQQAGLPDMRWRDLRHSCASLLVAEGVGLPMIRDILGHSQIAVTMRCAHLVPGLKKPAASAMGSALAKP